MLKSITGFTSNYIEIPHLFFFMFPLHKSINSNNGFKYNGVMGVVYFH